MARCLQLARHGETGAPPNPLVGAVVVHDGRIIGEGWHRRYGEAHAEVNAIESISAEDRPLLSRATVYVSLEPCAHWGKTPPCADLLVRCGVRRVVIGCEDPFAQVHGRGIQRLREAGAEVVVGVLEQECRALNKRFMCYHSLHRPWITLKWAESADGFIDRRRNSRDDGEAVHFSTPWTQALVHRLRATHQAILVGRRTWELDAPSLTTRLWPGPSPQRYILSRQLPEFHGASAARPHVIRRLEELTEAGSAGQTLPQSLLVEGGTQTLQAFLDADLWDELYIERSTLVLGDGIRAPQIQTDPKGRDIHVNFT